MGKKIKFGTGKAQISIEGSLAEDLENELREILGPVVETLEDKVEPILSDAKEKWPVRSGKSKEGFSINLAVHPDSYKILIDVSNTEFYTKFIKNSTKVGDKKDAIRPRNPAKEHLIKPARKAAKELKAELVTLLAELIQNNVLN